MHMPQDAPVRSKDNFLVFGSPYIGEEEIDEVVNCLRSGWIGTGPKVAKFENNFARYKQSQYAVALSSCTAALHLSMLASGLKSGDEVITTPLTFCATVNAIIHSGATPVLADVCSETMNIDPEQVRKKITSRTRAILPVHFAGRPCDMGGLVELVQEHNLLLIEDCAHAIESTWRGKPTGTFGQYGCFSFYATKNVVTGEGGMLITSDEHAASRIKTLGLHGMSKDAWKRFSDSGYKHYFVTDAGFKCNMTDLQASLGLHQLERVERCWVRRQEIWEKYNDAFSALPLTLPADVPDYMRHAYHLYTILVDEERVGISRDKMLGAFTEEGIGVGVHYLSIPEHPFYQQTFGWRPEDYPNAMRIGRQTISLPLSVKLTDDDVNDVICAVRKICRRG